MRLVVIFVSIYMYESLYDMWLLITMMMALMLMMPRTIPGIHDQAGHDIQKRRRQQQVKHQSIGRREKVAVYQCSQWYQYYQ